MADTQKTVTVATKWKDDGLGNLSREVKKVGNGFEELKRQVKAADGSITTTLSRTGKASNNMGKSVVQSMGLMQKGINGVGVSVKGLFVKMIALEALKKVFSGMYDSWKLYDEAIGANNVDKLTKSFQGLQLQIGSVLNPAFNDLHSWLEKVTPYFKFLSSVVVNSLVQAIKLLGSTVMVVAATISTGIAGIITLISGFVKHAVSSVNWLVQHLPGIPEGFKTAMQGADDAVVKFNKGALDYTKFTFGKVGEYLGNMGDNIKDAFTIPKMTNVQLIDPKVLEKAKEDYKRLNEDLKKIRKIFDDAVLEMDAKRYLLIENGNDKELADIKHKYLKEAEIYNNYITEVMQISEKRLKAELAVNGDSKKAYQTYNRDMYNIITAKNSILIGLEKDMNSEIEALRKSRMVSAMQDGMEELDAEIAAKEQIRDISIASVKDRVAQAKLISDASYNEQVMALKDHLSRLLITQAEYNNAVDNLDKQRKENIKNVEKEIFNERVSQAQMMADSVFSIVDNLHKVQLNNIDAERASRVESINSSIKSERHRSRAIERLDKEMEEKRRASYRKQQGWAIAQATVDGAVAIMKGFADYGPVVGGIMAALTAAVTTTQIAVISSQKFASGGIVQGSGQKDSKRAMLSPGEAVLTTEQQRRFMAIANGQVAPGGGASIISNDTIIVNGSLDMAAAERIRVDRERQLARLRDDMRELKYRGQLVVA